VDFPPSKLFKCATFKKNLRHIILRKNIYYLCIKIKNKVVKYSLKTKDVEFAKYLRNLIIKKLKALLKMNRNDFINAMLNDKYAITYSIDVKPDPNDPQETEEIAEKIAKQLAKKYNLNIENETPTIKKDEIEKINYSNIENYFNEFLNQKIKIEKRGISTEKAYIASFNYLKFSSDENTIYNFAFFKQFQKNLMIIPSNMNKFKKFQTTKIDELAKIYKKENYETLSNKTINNHMVNIGNFFDDLVYNEIIEINHCKKVKKLLEEDSEKIAYSKDDLIKIFESDELDQELKQFCKVALYTGARIGEIANIKKDDIDFKENIIKINGTKTKNANRIMPISPHILDILKDRIKKNKGQFLFFEDNNIDRIGKVLNRRLNKIIIEDVKSFHSFRKNFSQEILKTNAEEHTRKYLMGHSLNKDITHKIYNQNQMNMNKLFECIKAIEFEEIENSNNYIFNLSNLKF